MEHMQRNHYPDAQPNVSPRSRVRGNDSDIIVYTTKRTDKSKSSTCQRDHVASSAAVTPLKSTQMFVRGFVPGHNACVAVSRQSRQAYSGGPSAETRFNPNSFTTGADNINSFLT